MTREISLIAKGEDDNVEAMREMLDGISYNDDKVVSVEVGITLDGGVHSPPHDEAESVTDDTTDDESDGDSDDESDGDLPDDSEAVGYASKVAESPGRLSPNTLAHGAMWELKEFLNATNRVQATAREVAEWDGGRMGRSQLSNGLGEAYRKLRLVEREPNVGPVGGREYNYSFNDHGAAELDRVGEPDYDAAQFATDDESGDSADSPDA